VAVQRRRPAEYSGAIEAYAALAFRHRSERRARLIGVALQVTLVQCVPRGDRMDFIVQKATESAPRARTGVSPASVVRLDAE